jgi:chemotaxis protein methyltransferase CheR
MGRKAWQPFRQSGTRGIVFAEGSTMAECCARKTTTYEPAPSEGSVDHYLFTQVDFTRIREIIYHLAGISLAPGKRDMVYSRLARRLRARELDNFADYLKIIESGDPKELEAFINALTTNMTSFYREPHHFKTLAEHLATFPQGRPVSIWTCASSTGEEPYSIAMTAVDAMKGPAHQLRILATDIDTNVLETARKGIYPTSQLDKIPPQYLKRFFLRGEGRNAGFGMVREELKQLISFRRLNLLDETWPMRGKFEFIFCRNVMIYFDKKTQHEILRRLADHLQPGGILFVGHSESFHGSSELFRICGNTAYTLR